MEFYIRDVAMRELSDFEFYTRQFIQEFHIEIHELLGKNPQKEICKNLTKIYQNDNADTIRANIYCSTIGVLQFSNSTLQL